MSLTGLHNSKCQSRSLKFTISLFSYLIQDALQLQEFSSSFNLQLLQL